MQYSSIVTYKLLSFSIVRQIQIQLNTYPGGSVAEKSALEIAWTFCLLYKA